MVNETILAIIIAFAISAALCPVVIPFLHRLKFGQQVRDDGPQSHLKKQGTPTMGGLIILTATVITSYSIQELSEDHSDPVRDVVRDIGFLTTTSKSS